MNCIICGGETFLLGQLGSLLWFRCRDCGMDQNTPASLVPLDVAIEDEDQDIFEEDEQC